MDVVVAEMARNNAREYTLSNYAYEILKVFLGFLIFGMIFGLACGLALVQCLLIPFFVVGLKVCVAAYFLRKYLNCDHSLLTYSFYKQPKFVLQLYQIRLSIVSNNLKKVLLENHISHAIMIKNIVEVGRIWR